MSLVDENLKSGRRLSPWYPDVLKMESKQISKIISNLDPGALKGLDQIRCLIRILYHGLSNYRVKPLKGLGKNVMTEKQLCDLLGQSRFAVASTETIKDTSRSSNIPVEYIRAVKV
jgi:hypothetical protein